MITYKLYKSRGLVFQSIGKPSRFSKTSIDSSFGKKGDSILSVFIEICIKYALIHKSGIVIKKNPAQVMQFERCKKMGSPFNSLSNGISVISNYFCASRV